MYKMDKRNFIALMIISLVIVLFNLRIQQQLAEYGDQIIELEQRIHSLESETHLGASQLDMEEPE
jgi:hypothetical protein